MERINGYTKEEAKNLVRFICEEKKHGKTLTRIFEEYAKSSGRARGSVRNYYYALLKSKDRDDVKKLLTGTNLHAEDVKPFTDAETDKILREILRQKAQGVSVRRAVLNLSGGDDKLMLRYQNKYRNVAAKEPQRIEAIINAQKFGEKDTAKRAVEEKINDLYDGLCADLKAEIERLTAVIKRLRDENTLLRLQVKNLQL